MSSTLDAAAVIEANKIFRVTDFNNPEKAREVALMTALEEAKDPFEANALAYKIIVIGELSKRGIFPKDGQLSVGVLAPYEGKTMRIDAISEMSGRSVTFVRCLGEDERLAQDEYFFLGAVAHSPDVVKLIVAHQSDLHPLDAEMCRRLAETTKTMELLSLPVTGVGG